jgi:glycosyltransferase involved in cell wall biosynthesis
MSSIRISIVTICYNNYLDLRPTIESVVGQTYKNIEYIIVDGGSTDGSVNIINEYSDRISKFVSEPDQGLYDAINKGMKLATGDVIGLIHAGDRLFDKNVIKKIADHFIKYDIDASYGHSLMINSRNRPVRVNKSSEYSKKLVRRGWMPSHQSIYIRSASIERLGYYNLDLHPSSDYEFFLRYFYFNDIKIKRLDEFIVRFSLGGRSTRNYMNNLKAQKQHVECWLVNGEAPPFYLVPMKLIRKLKQFSLALFYKP